MGICQNGGRFISIWRKGEVHDCLESNNNGNCSSNLSFLDRMSFLWLKWISRFHSHADPFFLTDRPFPSTARTLFPCSIIHICHYLYSLQFHRNRGPISFLADLWVCLISLLRFHTDPFPSHNISIPSPASLSVRPWYILRFLCDRAQVYGIFIDLWVNLIVFLLLHFLEWI